jgi:FkbM family methyltransferase
MLVLSLLTPFRKGAVRGHRGSLVRSACIAFLKIVSKRIRVASSVQQVRPLDFPEVSFAATDSMVIDSIFWFGVQGYEGIMSEVWQRLCSESGSVLEIGANVGLFSVLGGRKAKGVYTVVEPLPDVARVLRGNLSRNGLRDVEVIEGAAIPSEKAATVRLNVPKEGRDAPVGAHLVIGSEVSARSSDHYIDVAGVPFVELLEGRTLVKIDAEGIEHQLLEAGRAIILRDRPTIVVEVLPESHRLAALICELALQAGYTINVVPAYGSDEIVQIAPASFTAATPAAYRSKDVVLSSNELV